MKRKSEIAQGLVVDPAFVPEIRRHFGAHLEVIDAGDWMRAMDNLEDCEGYPQADQLATIPIVAGVASEANPEIGSFESRCSSSGVPFSSFFEDESSRAIEWLVGIVLSKSESDRIDAAGARRSAAILREELDSQRRAFEELATAASSSLIPIRTLALDWGNTFRTFSNRNVIPETKKVRTLIQRLPVSGRAISAIDLHITDVGTSQGRDASVVLELRDLNGKLLAGPVGTGLAEISPGWHRFLIAAFVESMDPEIRLLIHRESGCEIEFSLGVPQATEDFRLATPDGTVLSESSLAVRVWRGQVGVVAAGKTGSMAGKETRTKLPSQLPGIELHSNDGGPMNFKSVDFWGKKDAFLVHPPESGMTVAVVRSISLSGVTAITSLVNSNHRKGPVISFAMGIVRKGESLHPRESLGQWLSLPPLEWGEVHLRFDRPVGGEFDLVLASMVAGGKGNGKAWALFRGFVFHSEEIS